MSDPSHYKVHFGKPARSKYYSQSIELAELAFDYQVIGTGEDEWHIVTISVERLDLLASLYPLAEKLPLPKIHGADLQYLYAYAHSGGTYDYRHASNATKKKAKRAADRLMKEHGFDFEGLASYLETEYLSTINSDMQASKRKLVEEGMIDHVDQKSGSFVRAGKDPKEPVPQVQIIKERIRSSDYSGAVNEYYEWLGDDPFGPLTYELIYLKRLAKKPLEPRDYLYFKGRTTKTELIDENINEYLDSIQETLNWARSEGIPMPMDIILEAVPTMDELVDRRRKKWHQGVYIREGNIEMDNTPVTIDGFTYKWDWCQSGRLFSKYPDPILYSRILEHRQRTEALGLWTKHSAEFLQQNVYERGFHVNAIDVYYHREWGKATPKSRRYPDFSTASSLEQLSYLKFMPTETVESIDPGQIRYTGRTHVVEGETFYEIDIIKAGGYAEAEVLGNPFLDAVDEILRESENRLRERHDLPRIGEGWVSEMELFHLLKARYPSAIHHARPDWLTPQHLDVFIPKAATAFEYHGRQHFEPVDFFGGDDALHDAKARDERKAKKCKQNEVTLIVWRYDEPINEEVLDSKLADQNYC